MVAERWSRQRVRCALQSFGCGSSRLIFCMPLKACRCVFNGRFADHRDCPPGLQYNACCQRNVRTYPPAPAFLFSPPSSPPWRLPVSLFFCSTVACLLLLLLLPPLTFPPCTDVSFSLPDVNSTRLTAFPAPCPSLHLTPLPSGRPTADLGPHHPRRLHVRRPSRALPPGLPAPTPTRRGC